VRRAPVFAGRRHVVSVRVAFQGELGAFSEEAVGAFFGAEAEPVPRRAFHDVGQAVIGGDVDFGMLPVENSLAGGVAAAYDVLAELDLRVIGEVIRPIRHCLLGTASATTDSIRRVLSHPVALAQCTRFFRERPGIEAIAVYDTAGAAREVADAREASRAAIAGRLAAERYGLRILRADVQDRSDNQTRFYAVARSDAAAPPETQASGPHKTALLFETENRPGALVDALLPFARRRINLSRIESRPASVPWTYRFIVELIGGDPDAEDIALSEVRERAASLRVLGRFPAAAASPPEH
jgi:prephenate dehydratase